MTRLAPPSQTSCDGGVALRAVGSGKRWLVLEPSETGATVNYSSFEPTLHAALLRRFALSPTQKMLRRAHFGMKGGLLTFAAVWTNGSYAQEMHLEQSV